jgi:dihydrofolate reductase
MYNGVQVRHIVAMNQQRVIGVDNQLPWSIVDDMARFKSFTSGEVIVMGRKTYDSLGRTLPNRDHYVLSRTPQVNTPNVYYFTTLDALMTAATEQAKFKGLDHVWIIGGSQLYHATMLFTDVFEVTKVADGGTGRSLGRIVTYPEWPRGYAIEATPPTPWQMQDSPLPAYCYVRYIANPNWGKDRI